jgi:hypothetical protein
MRYRERLAWLALMCLLTSASGRAGEVGYVTCPSGEGYVYLYQSVDSFQVLANLRCGEKVEIVDPKNTVRVKVKTLDGKEGYLPHSAVTAIAPGNQQQNKQTLAPLNTAMSASVAPSVSTQQPPQTPEFTSLSSTQTLRKHMIHRRSRVYIEPMGGFESTLAAAFDNKQVPLVIVTDKSQAEYLITGTTEEKKHSTGQKVGMTILLGRGGAAMTADQMKGSIQIVDLKTSAIVYAYTATKGDRAQSVAEACAKHVKSEALAP